MKDPETKGCPYCGRPYLPDPRTAKTQKACARPRCRRARQRQNWRRWSKLHPGYAASRQAKTRAWARAYPDYWSRYRAAHRAYARRDNRRRTEAMRRARCSAKQITMRTVVVEKLRALEALDPPVRSAKQTAMARRVDAIDDCLRSTVAVVCSAKPSAMAWGRPHPG